MQGVIYISNKSQNIKDEEQYGKTIYGVPLSFQDFFQIRETSFSFHVHFKRKSILAAPASPRLLAPIDTTKTSCENLELHGLARPSVMHDTAIL